MKGAVSGDVRVSELKTNVDSAGVPPVTNETVLDRKISDREISARQVRLAVQARIAGQTLDELKCRMVYHRMRSRARGCFERSAPPMQRVVPCAACGGRMFVEASVWTLRDAHRQTNG